MRTRTEVLLLVVIAVIALTALSLMGSTDDDSSDGPSTKTTDDDTTLRYVNYAYKETTLSGLPAPESGMKWVCYEYVVSWTGAPLDLTRDGDIQWALAYQFGSHFAPVNPDAYTDTWLSTKGLPIISGTRGVTMMIYQIPIGTTVSETHPMAMWAPDATTARSCVIYDSTLNLYL